MKCYKSIIRMVEEAGKKPSDLSDLDSPRIIGFPAGIAQKLKNRGVIKKHSINQTHNQRRYLWVKGPTYSAFMEAWRKHDVNRRI